jgi:hypothetical protein
VHGVIDYIFTIALIAAPFLFGFSDDTTALAFFLTVGGGGLLLVLATRFVSDLPPKVEAQTAQSPELGLREPIWDLEDPELPRSPIRHAERNSPRSTAELPIVSSNTAASRRRFSRRLVRCALRDPITCSALEARGAWKQAWAYSRPMAHPV